MALVVVIAVVAGVVFFTMQGGQPVASASPSASASESLAASQPPSDAPQTATPLPTAEPSVQAGPIEVAWEPITGLEAAATVFGVAFIDGQWLALGQEFPTAAIWTSTDGRSWTRATIEGAGGADVYSIVTDVVELDGALVAIGSWGAMQSDQSAWTTFRSTDGGATWTESRDGPAPYALHAIAGAGPGLVVGGWEYAGTTPFDSFIATSEDGETFTLTDGRFENSEVHDLAVIGDRIVAVGNAWLDAPEFAPDTAAWYSDDAGVTWTPVEVPDGGTSETISDLLPFGDGLVAIGGGGSVGAWITADGMTWERFEVAASAQSVAIATVAGSLVAVGNAIGQDIGPGASWISPDGRTWVEGGALGDGSVRHSSVASDGQMLVAGGECLAQSCATVLWVGVVSP